MDRILISDLAARCIIGMNEEERREKQDILINITLLADLRAAGRSDRFEDTVDYRGLKKRILKMVEDSHFHLVEALAEEVAAICLAEPKVRQAIVRVEKPSALRFARTVGVQIERPAAPLKGVRAFIAVGSNIDPEENVPKAMRLLAERTRLVGLSTVYQTGPEGRPEQPRYYNLVVEIRTDLSPNELKRRVLREIERELGRRRTADKYAPRVIDLDLILYGDMVSTSGSLRLPDPQIQRRPFLAVPLCELAPHLVLPGGGMSIEEVVRKQTPADMTPLYDFSELLRKEIGDGARPGKDQGAGSPNED
jgi:2-amino-4-hydroxy-6-hydroxymethyldihydropteridine diphosphokinase